MNKIVVLIKIKNTNTKNIKSKFNPQGWNRWYNCRTSTFYTEDYYQSQLSILSVLSLIDIIWQIPPWRTERSTKYYSSIVSIYMTSIPVLQIFYLIEDLDNFFYGLAAGIPGQCFLIFFFTFLSPQSFVHLRQKYFEQLTFKIFSTINILFGANSSRQTDSLSIHSLQTIVFFLWMKRKKLILRYFYSRRLWLTEYEKCFPKKEVPEHFSPCPGESIWRWKVAAHPSLHFIGAMSKSKISSSINIFC